MCTEIELGGNVILAQIVYVQGRVLHVWNQLHQSHTCHRESESANDNAAHCRCPKTRRASVSGFVTLRSEFTLFS